MKLLAHRILLAALLICLGACAPRPASDLTVPEKATAVPLIAPRTAMSQPANPGAGRPELPFADSTAVPSQLASAVAAQQEPLIADAMPTPRLAEVAGEQRQVTFRSGDILLAGELDLPKGQGPWPLVVIIHHSGPVTRDAYGYLAELLVPRGFAVFRFDKQGTGQSEGDYGCCEADDALAAYAAAVRELGVDGQRVILVAQSIGTSYLAQRFDEFAAIHPPLGVALLSNQLGPEEVLRIAAPALIIVADSEPDLQTIGPLAAEAHASAFPGGTELYVADGAEHTLFDVSAGPLDWSDPGWVERYHRGAMGRLIDWLVEILLGPVPLHGGFGESVVKNS